MNLSDKIENRIIITASTGLIINASLLAVHMYVAEFIPPHIGKPMALANIAVGLCLLFYVSCKLLSDKP